MARDFTHRIMLYLLRRSNNWISDERFIKLLYRLEMGRSLDLKAPVTMNEKLQWLKLNNRHDDLTDLVDKVKVKDRIAPIVGNECVVPTLKVWDSANDITEEDIKSLPEQFVIKTNHSGGNTGVYICRDKSELDLKTLISKMNASLGTDIYKAFGEWPYKNVEKKVFAEKYLGDKIVDYKFYCFNGEVDSVMLCLNRQEDGPTKFYFFNRDWELCRYNKAGKAAPENFTLPKPEGMDNMFDMAAKLSAGHPFVRVDLYNVEGQIYFGELTFFPASGLDANRLPESDLYFGQKIDLSLARNQYKNL